MGQFCSEARDSWLWPSNRKWCHPLGHEIPGECVWSPTIKNNLHHPSSLTPSSYLPLHSLIPLLLLPYPRTHSILQHLFHTLPHSSLHLTLTSPSPPLSYVFSFLLSLSQFPMSSREYVFLRRSWISAEEDAIVIVNKSVEHPHVPEGRKYVRVQSYFSEMVLRPHSFSDEVRQSMSEKTRLYNGGKQTFFIHSRRYMYLQ